ncbi:MAG: leucine-rich repeat domain-containing protein [Prevotella sp.]|nr:leucine-rich repeat domain-containing protein [Prevotella sp.]
MIKVNQILVILVFLLLLIPQQVNAQKQKKFDEAISNGWIEAKGYAYQDRITGESKQEKFKAKAREMGYFVNYFGVDCVYFCRADEKGKLDLEIEYVKRGEEYKQFRNGKKIKGSSFKNVGTAYVLYMLVYNHPWFGSRNDREIYKCSEAKWTGQLKDGKLEGEGDGYCVTKTQDKDYSCAFSGTFHNGFMVKGKYWYFKELPGKNWFGHRIELETTPFSEGLAFMKYKFGNWNTAIIDSNGKILVHQGPLKSITDVKQNFNNGKAIVTMNGMDVIINPKGEIIGIDNNVNTITSNIFSGETSCHMKSIILPNSVQTIAPKAFSSNKYLEEISLPEGLVEIGKEAFSFCSALKSIKLPSTITKIGIDAFSYCENLTSVTIPVSLINYIKGQHIFKKCKQLNEVNVVAENGKIVKDDNWYWKEEMSQEAQMQLAEEKKEQKRIENQKIENSYDFPQPDKKPDFKHDNILEDIFEDYKSGYAVWNQPNIHVTICWKVSAGYNRYFFYHYKNGRRSVSPDYRTYDDVIAAAWFYFVHGKTRTRGLWNPSDKDWWDR